YSLNRQTIRYDFLDKIDVRVFDTKNNAFFHCSDSEFKNSKFKINFDSDRVNAFLKKVNKSSSEYPVVIKHQEKYKCAIKVEFKKPFPNINKQVGLADGLKLFPLLTDGLNVYYDASPAFKIYESFRSHELCVKKVWDRNDIFFEFWVSKLYTPNICKNVFDFQKSSHKHIDFGKKHFMSSLRLM
ncbi:MAG: hypothetical protein P8104_00245, partial [Gammaproteobacteria bacterium]